MRKPSIALSADETKKILKALEEACVKWRHLGQRSSKKLGVFGESFAANHAGRKFILNKYKWVTMEDAFSGFGGVDHYRLYVVDGKNMFEADTLYDYNRKLRALKKKFEEVEFSPSAAEEETKNKQREQILKQKLLKEIAR